MAFERLEILKKLIEQNPDESFNLYALGLEYLNIDKLESKTIFETLINKDPSFLASYYQLGSLLIELGQIAEALKVLKAGKIIAKAQNNHKTFNEINSLILEIEFDV